MAALGSQTIAASYEQLLHVDADGGGNGNTLVNVKMVIMEQLLL